MNPLSSRHQPRACSTALRAISWIWALARRRRRWRSPRLRGMLVALDRQPSRRAEFVDPFPKSQHHLRRASARLLSLPAPALRGQLALEGHRPPHSSKRSADDLRRRPCRTVDATSPASTRLLFDGVGHRRMRFRRRGGVLQKRRAIATRAIGGRPGRLPTFGDDDGGCCGRLRAVHVTTSAIRCRCGSSIDWARSCALGRLKKP